MRPQTVSRWISALVVTLLTLARLASGAEYTLTGPIEGKVLDERTGEPLAGCNIRVLDSPLGAASALDGAFTVAGVQVGVHSLQASMVGYETRVVTDVIVKPTRNDPLEIRLQPAVMQLESIVVRPDYFAVRSEGGAPAVKYNREEIRRAPGSAEDVSRMLHVHPAVAMGVDDQRNDLVVRGGNPIENLLVVDGHPVQNLSHFASQGSTGGPVSILQADFIDEVRFVPGSFDARHGNRLSSVMDLRMRRGNDHETRGEFYTSMAGAGFQLEGPVAGGSFLMGGRRSYLELMTSQLNLASAPVMADYNTKFSWPLGDHDRIEWLLLASTSRIRQSAEDDEDMGMNYDTRVKNGMSGLHWRHFSPGGTTHTLSYTLNLQLFEETFSWYDDTEHSRNNARENQHTLQYETLRRLGPGTLAAGAGIERQDTRHDVRLDPYTTSFGVPIPGAVVAESLDKNRLFAWVNRVWWNRHGLQVTAGLRVDHEPWFDNTDLQPRLALRQGLGRDWAATASAGLYTQSIPGVWAVQDPGNRRVESMTVQQGQLGLEWQPWDAWLISLDGFYRRYHDMPFSIQQDWLPLAAAGSYFGYQDFGLIRSGGEGRSYGVEFQAQKKLSDRTYGTFSYAWSLSRYRTETGPWMRGPFDRRHMATVIVGYIPSNRLELSLRWAVSGGAPTTPMDLAASAQANRSRYDAGLFNSDRLPVYHRLDLRADWRFRPWLNHGLVYLMPSARGGIGCGGRSSGPVGRPPWDGPRVFPTGWYV
jgi:outer membrane receptor for ferrienterochelin and colicin